MSLSIINITQTLCWRKINIIHFRWMITQVVNKMPLKIILIKGFKLFFLSYFFVRRELKDITGISCFDSQEIYIWTSLIVKKSTFELLHLNFFDGHEKYILSLHWKTFMTLNELSMDNQKCMDKKCFFHNH